MKVCKLLDFLKDQVFSAFIDGSTFFREVKRYAGMINIFDGDFSLPRLAWVPRLFAGT
jgi:hypothetical protein